MSPLSPNQTSHRTGFQQRRFPGGLIPVRVGNIQPDEPLLPASRCSCRSTTIGTYCRSALALWNYQPRMTGMTGMGCNGHRFYRCSPSESSSSLCDSLWPLCKRKTGERPTRGAAPGSRGMAAPFFLESRRARRTHRGHRERKGRKESEVIIRETGGP
jgi:hypothetical protein